MNNFDILAKCKGYTNIYIYGAGINAQRLYNYLVCNFLTVSGFIVSTVVGNPSILFGIPVVEIKDYKQKKADVILCSIVYLSPHYNSVFETISTYMLKNVIYFSRKTFNGVYNFSKNNEKKRLFNKWNEIFGGSEYCINTDIVTEDNHAIFLSKEDGKQYLWRIQHNHFSTISNVNQILNNSSIAKEFSKQYGEYHFLHEVDNIKDYSEANLQIYMAINIQDKLMNIYNLPAYITPIQAGAATAPIYLCDIKDNAGDNISERNDIYSECTVMYWLWKNACTTDYVGLCQYRRHIDIPNNDLRLLTYYDVDILTTTPTFLLCDVGTLFLKFLPKQDVNVFMKAISDIAPTYKTDAEIFFKSRFYPPCNVFVMRREIFQEYAKIVFDITFWIEEYYNAKNIVRHDRFMGYLIECMLGIFMMHHKHEYNVSYTLMRFFKQH